MSKWTQTVGAFVPQRFGCMSNQLPRGRAAARSYGIGEGRRARAVGGRLFPSRWGLWWPGCQRRPAERGTEPWAVQRPHGW